MAKVPFTKLKCKLNTSVKELKVGNEIIEIKQYLPLLQKLELLERVVVSTYVQNDKYNSPVKARIFTELEIVQSYTNLSFTEKQKEDVAILYDLLGSSGVMEMILNNIPVEELDFIFNGVSDNLKGIYEYQNSFVGVLENIQQDKAFENNNLAEIINTIQNSDNFKLVKEIYEQQ